MHHIVGQFMSGGVGKDGPQSQTREAHIRWRRHRPDRQFPVRAQGAGSLGDVEGLIAVGEACRRVAGGPEEFQRDLAIRYRLQIV